MTVKWKCLVLYIVFIQFTISVFSEMYKITLKSIELCPEAEPPYEKEKLITLDVLGYNKSNRFYFKGNLTIKSNLKGYFFKIKAGVEKAGGGVKYTNSFKKLSCKSVIPKLMLITSGVRYNEKTCEMYKGNYSFNKMDINDLQPGAYYYPIKEMGENVVYFGVYNARGTGLCTFTRFLRKSN